MLLELAPHLRQRKPHRQQLLLLLRRPRRQRSLRRSADLRRTRAAVTRRAGAGRWHLYARYGLVDEELLRGVELEAAPSCDAISRQVWMKSR